MIQQTIFPFKIKTTKERLTAHGGLALMAEFNHGIGLRGLTAFVSGVLGETYHCDVSLEDGAGGGSDCETCWRDAFEVNDRSGKVGIV
jgi:hypothetical protein